MKKLFISASKMLSFTTKIVRVKPTNGTSTPQGMDLDSLASNDTTIRGFYAFKGLERFSA